MGEQQSIIQSVNVRLRTWDLYIKGKLVYINQIPYDVLIVYNDSL